MKLNDTYVFLTDGGNSITRVTVKYAPVELDDNDILGILSQYGQIIGGSIRQGVIRGTKIETGTR